MWVQTPFAEGLGTKHGFVHSRISDRLWSSGGDFWLLADDVGALGLT